MERLEALAIKRRAQRHLFTIPGVRMVGLGRKVSRNCRTGAVAIRVFVDRKLPVADLPPRELIPKEFEGLQTDVEEVGEVSLLNGAAAIADGEDPIPDDPLEREHRPLTAATKITNVREEYHRFSDVEGEPIGKRIVPAFGTLGCFVRTVGAGEQQRICALTCQHVTNPAHTTVGTLAPDLAAGREIYQPEPFFGPSSRPKPDSETGKTDCFCGCETQQERRRMGRVLRAKNSAEVDASLVALKGDLEYRQQLLDLQGLLGPTEGLVAITGSRKRPNPPAPVFEIDEVVFKLGYRTGTVRGIISDEEVEFSDTVLDSELGPYRAAPAHTFLVKPEDPEDPDNKLFALPGDSGCVVIDAQGKVVGLLWGGRNSRDPDNPHIIVESYGLIDPIDYVEEEMECEVLVHDPDEPVQETDGDNLDGVPHIDEEGNPVAAATTRERALLVLELLRGRPKGEELAGKAQRVVKEVVDLLHGNARVRTVWSRYGGPGIAGLFLYGMMDLQERVPSLVWGQPLGPLAQKIGSELAKVGSSELRDGLDAILPLLVAPRGCTFEEVLVRWEQVSCPSSL